MSQATTHSSSPIASSPSFGRIVMISLSVLMLGLAIAWIGFFLTQY